MCRWTRQTRAPALRELILLERMKNAQPRTSDVMDIIKGECRVPENQLTWGSRETSVGVSAGACVEEEESDKGLSLGRKAGGKAWGKRPLLSWKELKWQGLREHLMGRGGLQGKKRLYFLVLPFLPTRCPPEYIPPPPSSIAPSLEILYNSRLTNQEPRKNHRPKGESLRAFPVVWSGYKFRLLLEKNEKPPRHRLPSFPSSPAAALFLSPCKIFSV